MASLVADAIARLVPRTCWAFYIYIYYVGHLALLAVLARTMVVHAA
jgi:hypothetical protein